MLVIMTMTNVTCQVKVDWKLSESEKQMFTGNLFFSNFHVELLEGTLTNDEKDITPCTNTDNREDNKVDVY